MSLGFEIRNGIISEIDSLYQEGMHLQVTIPNHIPYQEIKSVIKGREVLAHSNLLNVLGDNDFFELQKYIPQISSLSPITVIEHFTELRDEKGEKYGVHIPGQKSDQEIVELARKNVLQWSSLLKFSVSLENAPITENVLRYFRLLKEVQKRTNCMVTIDVPHLMVSYCSLENPIEKNELLEIIDELDVNHIHLAGVSIKDGIIDDSHHLANFKLVLSYARKWFPQCQYITVEQAPSTKSKKVIECLKVIKDKSTLLPEISTLDGLSAPCQEEINKELAIEGFSDLSQSKKDEVKTVNLLGAINRENPFYYFEKYDPFFYPIDSIKTASKQFKKQELMLTSALLAKWGLKFLSWSHPEIEDLNLFCGEGESTIFSTSINRSDQKMEAKKFNKYHELQFGSPSNFWVKIQVPEQPSKRRLT